jgi:N-acetyl-alpha-D-glucosaminyl L-malate synthase BshA
VTRFSIEQSDGVTAISDYLSERTLKEFAVKKPIEVIYNFVNCDLYRRSKDVSAERSVFAEPNEKIIVHLSNFRPVKRIGDVVEIFQRIQKEIPSRLIMIGDGPERSAAEWQVHRLGLRDRVYFLGKQGNVHEKLAIADLMLLPSQLESFGLAALEAMACEVPTVATNVGGLPEVIEHGKNGFLAAVGDVDLMARCAIDILSDDKKLREMGKLARFEAQSRFCASKIIPQYENFYERVLRAS